MKILVRGTDQVVLQAYRNSDRVNMTDSAIVEKNFVRGQLTCDNCALVQVDSVPADFAPVKYRYVDGVFVANPYFRTREQKLSAKPEDAAKLQRYQQENQRPA